MVFDPNNILLTLGNKIHVTGTIDTSNIIIGNDMNLTMPSSKNIFIGCKQNIDVPCVSCEIISSDTTLYGGNYCYDSVVLGKSNILSGDCDGGLLIGYNNTLSCSPLNNFVCLGTNLNITNPSGFFVSNISSFSSTNPTGTLMYDDSSKEIYHNTSKTFVIQHPEHEAKYLVHACLEGPESGVYYRGISKVDNLHGSNFITNIQLPSYLEKFSSDFTVSAKPIIAENDTIPKVCCTKVVNNMFTVVSNVCCEINWLVIGKREQIQTEIEKNEIQIKGKGPYTWL